MFFIDHSHTIHWNNLWVIQHVQQLHPELWCGACGVGFASSGQLLEHYLDAESSVHPTCTACGEGFETQAVLNEVTHLAAASESTLIILRSTLRLVTRRPRLPLLHLLRR